MLKNWEAIKRAEREASGEDEPKGALAGVPEAMPALLRAERVQEQTPPPSASTSPTPLARGPKSRRN